MPLLTSIEQTWTALPYPRDIKHHMLWAMIDTLLNADNDVPLQTARNAALTSAQAWITTQLKLNASPQAVAGFYTVYQGHLQLLQNKGLLLLSNRITNEGIEQLIQDCESYYQLQIQMQTPGVESLAKPPLELLERITALQQAIKDSKKDTFSDRIENFFTLWFLAKEQDDIDSTKRLYSLLIEEKVQEKMQLTDAMLENWKKKITEEQGQTVRDITPYEINRLFLHAIINNPSTWTPTFVSVFQETLQFVKQSLAENSLLGQSLKNDAYPPALIAQLDYLQALNAGAVDTGIGLRPQGMILLPRHVKTAEEWMHLSSMLDDEKRKSAYGILRLYINGVLNKEITDENTFALSLRSLPSTERTAFIAQLGHEQLIQIIKTRVKFTRLLLKLSPEQYTAVFIAMGGHLQEMIKTVKDLSLTLKFLTPEQCTAVFTGIADRLPEILKTREDFKYILLNLYPDQRTALCTAIPHEKLIDFIHSREDYALLLDWNSSNVALKNALDEALSLRQMIQTITSLSTAEQADNVLSALVNNDQQAVKAGLNGLLNSLNQSSPKAVNPSSMFSSTVADQTPRRQAIIDVFSSLEPYWLNKLQTALGHPGQPSTVQAYVDQRTQAMETQSAMKRTRIG